MNNRIVTLDYLRGIAASIVMSGHYYVWINTDQPIPSTLHKMITFSVSIFYILSGITLYSVYHKSFKFDLQSFSNFALKRLFRILPLLWVATTLTIILTSVSHSWAILLLNYSGLFGFILPGAAIARAAWSIGNEMVFYAFFPLFVYLAQRRNKLWLYLYSFLSLLPAVYFTILKMGPVVSLSDQRLNLYLNPLNQLFLFVGGIVIAQLFKRKQLPYPNVLLIVCVALFMLYPIHDPVDLFTGPHRFMLCGICFLICIVLYTGKIFPPGWIHRPLTLLGETSYSIYLLHPIVYLVLSNVKSFNPILLYFTCIIVTPISSYFVYSFIEKPGIKLGGKAISLVQKIRQKFLPSR